MEAKSERGSSRVLALQAWPTLKRCDEGALLAGLEFVCIFGHDAVETARRASLEFVCVFGQDGIVATASRKNVPVPAAGSRTRRVPPDLIL